MNDITINIFLHTIFSFIWIRLSLWEKYPRVELLGQKACTFLLLLICTAKLLSSWIIPIHTPMNSVWDKDLTAALPAWGAITFKIHFVNVIVIWYLSVILIVGFFLRWFSGFFFIILYIHFVSFNESWRFTFTCLALRFQLCLHFKLSEENHLSCSQFTIFGGTGNTLLGTWSDTKWNAFPKYQGPL